MNDKPKKKAGRPPAGDAKLIQKSIRFTRLDWAAIDLAAKNRGISANALIAACVSHILPSNRN